MKLLLDTQVFLWSTMQQPFSQSASSAFLDPNNELYLSAASYWEICIKISIGKLTLADNWVRGIEDELASNEIGWLPITKEHCRQLVELPPLHGDPFDRLLIAQALTEKMTLLTADTNIRRYAVPTLW